MRKFKSRNNYKFQDSAIVNDDTYFDYLNRLKKIALSIFEWVNLPESMDARWLERSLYYNGMATMFKDKQFGFINTNCASSGYLNIYGLPTKLNCYAYNFQSIRTLYTGLNPLLNDKQKEKKELEECILVMNNWDRKPTALTLELFAYRLYEAERTADVNIKSQKFPVMIIVDEKQRLLMENLYNQYNGNQPFIFGDKDQLGEDILRSVNTGAPFIVDKLMNYKKEIWNEALQFLGVNSIMLEKKERMITDEANSNNEVINLNLQSYLAPRQLACKQFNEKYGLTGTDKEISVRVRSDLYNTIKKELGFAPEEEIETIKEDKKEIKEVVDNG